MLAKCVFAHQIQFWLGRGQTSSAELICDREGSDKAGKIKGKEGIEDKGRGRQRRGDGKGILSDFEMILPHCSS